MGNSNETQQLTSGQEKRLARKRAAEAAKKQKALTKILVPTVCILIIAAIVVASVFYIIKKSKETKVVTDYSQGLTSEGLIKGVDVASSITTLDYNNIKVDYSDIQFSDEDLQAEIDETLKEYATTNDDGTSTVPEFNDEFTTAYLDMTVEEYKNYIREEHEDENLATYINKLLAEKTTITVMPESYLKTVKGLIKYSDQQQFSYYQQLLAAYGSTQTLTFDSFTGMTTEQYEEYLDETAKSQIAGEMAAQYIFEKEGMTITDAEYSDYVTTFGSNAEESYGKPYIMRSLMFDKVVEFLKEKAVVNK